MRARRAAACTPCPECRPRHRDGEFVCVVGPSGCGKSTLLRMLAGLDTLRRRSRGAERRAGQGPSRDVGVVFQAANLLPWLTVRENVGCRCASAEAQARRGRIELCWQVTGLGDFGHRYPYELSGGMQQRAGICRALSRDPSAADGRAVRRARRADSRADESNCSASGRAIARRSCSSPTASPKRSSWPTASS